MAFATGGFHGLNCTEEIDFGVVPASPQMKRLRHTSCSLVLSKDSFQSDELRSDAQISDFRHGNKQASGDIGIEVSYGEYDAFLAAAIRSTGWAIDPETGNEAVVAGTHMRSFVLERVFNDIGQYEYFTGCEVNTLSFTVEPNSMVTGSIGIVGKNIEFSTTPLDPSPDPSLTASPFDGFKGVLEEGGAVIAVITSVEISIDNSIEAQFVIGSDTAEALTAGRINITGTITAFFENMDLLQKFVNETESMLKFTLGDGVRESYVFTLPRIKYSGGENPVDGEGVITLNMPFQALYDECTGTNIKIERVPGPVMPDCELVYTGGSDFLETAAGSRQFANVISATLQGGSKTKTFNGAINGPVPGVVWTGVPAGLTGVATKISATEVQLTLEGAATSAVVAGSISVEFSTAAFAFGYCHCPNNDVKDRIKTFTVTPG